MSQGTPYQGRLKVIDEKRAEKLENGEVKIENGEVKVENNPNARQGSRSKSIDKHSAQQDKREISVCSKRSIEEVQDTDKPSGSVKSARYS